MDREKWAEGWIDLPRYDCPTCNKGTLRQHGDIVAEETEYSKAEYAKDEWEPEWMTHRFVMLLKCDEPGCGEIVTVAGDRKVEVYEDYEENRQEVVEKYYPQNMHPAPYVFRIPPRLKTEPMQQLVKAFELMWADAGASANRIRIFVERLMDQYKVPTTGIDKKGNPYELKLFQRINEMEKMHPGHKDAFDALRWVGNYGSHSGDAKRETLLNCFEVLEGLLADLVEGRKDRLQNWQQQMIANKGKA